MAYRLTECESAAALFSVLATIWQVDDLSLEPVARLPAWGPPFLRVRQVVPLWLSPSIDILSDKRSKCNKRNN
jgi:hypothetical protein